MLRYLGNRIEGSNFLQGLIEACADGSIRSLSLVWISILLAILAFAPTLVIQLAAFGMIVIPIFIIYLGYRLWAMLHSPNNYRLFPSIKVFLLVILAILPFCVILWVRIAKIHIAYPGAHNQNLFFAIVILTIAGYGAILEVGPYVYDNTDDPPV